MTVIPSQNKAFEGFSILTGKAMAYYGSNSEKFNPLKKTILPENTTEILHTHDVEPVHSQHSLEKYSKMFFMRVGSVDKLFDAYKTAYGALRGGLPYYLHRIFQGKIHNNVKCVLEHPEQAKLIRCDGQPFFIQLNPTYCEPALYDHPQYKELSKDSPFPPRLTAWAIHPYFLSQDEYPVLRALDSNKREDSLDAEYNRIFKAPASDIQALTPIASDKDDYKKSTKRLTVAEIEKKTFIPYLSSGFSLTPEKHLKMMKELKENLLKHLKDTYDITPESHPNLRLFFHLPCVPAAATLHIHVSLTDVIPTEQNIFLVDDVISNFEAGRTIQDMFKDRYKDNGDIFYVNGYKPHQMTHSKIVGSDNIEAIYEYKNPYSAPYERKDFEVFSEKGEEGHHSRVTIVKKRGTDKEYAWKRMLEGEKEIIVGADKNIPAQLHTIEHEHDILMSLPRCPNIVKCKGMLEDGLLLERALPHKVKSVVLDDSLPLETAKFLLLFVVDGMLRGNHVLMDNNIAHNDGHDENYLFTKRGDVALIDFGKATRTKTPMAKDFSLPADGAYNCISRILRLVESFERRKGAFNELSEPLRQLAVFSKQQGDIRPQIQKLRKRDIFTQKLSNVKVLDILKDYGNRNQEQK